MKNDLKEIISSALKNWKTTIVAVLLLIFAIMRIAGMISTEELVTIMTALGALGFTLSKDSSK